MRETHVVKVNIPLNGDYIIYRNSLKHVNKILTPSINANR